MEGFYQINKRTAKKKSVCALHKCVLHKCAIDQLWPVCPQRARRKKTIVSMEKLKKAQQPSSCITYSQTSFQRKLGKRKVKEERLHTKNPHKKETGLGIRPTLIWLERVYQTPWLRKQESVQKKVYFLFQDAALIRALFLRKREKGALSEVKGQPHQWEGWDHWWCRRFVSNLMSQCLLLGGKCKSLEAATHTGWVLNQCFFFFPIHGLNFYVPELDVCTISGGGEELRRRAYSLFCDQ